MVGAGRRDRFGAIERKTITRTETGAEIETWVIWCTRWMGKRDITGTERLRADQQLATEMAIWDMLYVDGLRSEDRVSVEGKTYDIIGIREVGRRAEHEITAQAVRV